MECCRWVLVLPITFVTQPFCIGHAAHDQQFIIQQNAVIGCRGVFTMGTPADCQHREPVDLPDVGNPQGLSMEAAGGHQVHQYHAKGSK